MRQFFESGATRPASFRKEQLRKLQQAVVRHEKEIQAALYADLKKSREETYATEIALLLSEIRLQLRHMLRWMRPRRAGTNLANLPSSSHIIREPLGVVLIISPWNYPFQLSLIPLVGALAAGNAVVLKPSELSPATTALLGRLIREIYPPEYVQVILGEGARIVPALMEGFRFDHVFYTGSVAVGRSVYQLAARQLIPVTLELGGKNPAVIEADANLRVTARRIALGKFVNAGQSCVAPDYVLADHRIQESFVEEMRQALLEFFGPDPAASASYCRIINQRRFEKLFSYLSMGRIRVGGQHDSHGLYMAPTLLDEVSLDSPLMQEEIFGPILPVLGFRTRQEALSIIGSRPQPLSFYIYGANSRSQEEWLRSVSFGNGCVNNSNWQFTNPDLPFGGVGTSGIGAYHGKYSFDRFTHSKAVMKTPFWPDPDLRYPPFQGKLKWFRSLIR